MNGKRLFDISLSFLAIILILPVFLIISVIIWWADKSNPFYWSNRVGKGNEIFSMPKFRSMRRDTPQLATHLLENPDSYLLSVGPFLRKSSLDELPQLWSILTGKMSFVGPRPALFNQHDLIDLRTHKNVHTLVPGVTGWAQINGRDSISIPEKVELDRYYLENRSLWLDLKIILGTLTQVVASKNISH